MTRKPFNDCSKFRDNSRYHTLFLSSWKGCDMAIYRDLFSFSGRGTVVRVHPRYSHPKSIQPREDDEGLDADNSQPNAIVLGLFRPKQPLVLGSRIPSVEKERMIEVVSIQG